MPLFRNILFPMVMLMLSLTGCSGDDPVASPVDGEGVEPVYIRLQFSLPALSRGNPTAGEGGDVPEAGIRNENMIEDLSLLFYHDDTGEGLDLPAETGIIHTEYIDASSLSVSADGTEATATYRLGDGYIPVDGDRVLVAANMGDLRGISTLGEFRDMLVMYPWKAGATIPEYSRFTMATAKNDPDEGRIDVVNFKGTKENPYLAKVNIERTAARIDFWYDAAENCPSDRSELVYKAMDGSVETAKVHVTHILPVNLMQEPSYMVKRVTAGTSGLSAIRYCGDETVENLVPTNYVIEPHTLAKNTVGSAGLSLEKWYGDTRASYIRDNYSDGIFNEGNRLAAFLSEDQPVDYTESGYGFDKYVTLAYANENTQTADYHKSDFVTGLVFRAEYHPSRVYSDASAMVEAGYSTGDDLWRCTLSDQDMGDGKVVYFSSRDAAAGYAAKHGGLAHVTEYPGGVCYYTLWLRHADASSVAPGASTCPMEYGIVRNNIYRVGVSFHGPGDPVPELREPNTIRARIFVRKWNFRLLNEIVM